MRRVVVTGMGMVTPLGVGVEPVWKRLIAGESGIAGIQSFDVSDLPAKIAGQVPFGATADGRFDADDWMAPKDRRKVDPFIVFAMAAAVGAVEDAGWQPQDEEELERTGVMIGSGIGGLQAVYNGSITLHERGPRRISPFFIPSALINLASGQVSIRYGFKGPNHAVVTACSTGAHAIGDASRFIGYGDADVMLAGGAEAPVFRLGLAGFAASRALSTGFNDTPERASRPWDQDRDGFVLSNGAGVLVLEEMQRAQKRGGGRVRGESVFTDWVNDDVTGIEQIVGAEPTPDFAAQVAEQCEQLLTSLEDESLRAIARMKLEGYTNPEISEKIGVVERTVERRLRRIRREWSDGKELE